MTNELLKIAQDILETIDIMGHDDNTVIPIWPADLIMPFGRIQTFKDYPKLTVGMFRFLVEKASEGTA